MRKVKFINIEVQHDGKLDLMDGEGDDIGEAWDTIQDEIGDILEPYGLSVLDVTGQGE